MVNMCKALTYSEIRVYSKSISFINCSPLKFQSLSHLVVWNKEFTFSGLETPKTTENFTVAGQTVVVRWQQARRQNVDWQ